MATDLEEVHRSLRSGGLDIVHAANLMWLGLDPPSRFRPDALALVIGNTRAMWPHLRKHAKGDHPVNRYCTRLVASVLDDLDERFVVYWAHEKYDGAFLPFQRLAMAAGQSHLSPSYLSIHETYGPWFALRAIALIDRAGPRGVPRKAPDPCTPCDKPCMVALEAAQASNEWQAWLAVRDACPEGRAHRYPDAQIRYHYTKDLRWLVKPKP